MSGVSRPGEEERRLRRLLLEAIADEGLGLLPVPMVERRIVKDTKWLLFDMDETIVHNHIVDRVSVRPDVLLHTQRDEGVWVSQMGMVTHSVRFEGSEFFVTVRPGVRDLFTRAREAGWKVGVWSLSVDGLVDVILRTCFPDFRFDAVMGRSMATVNQASGSFYKDFARGGVPEVLDAHRVARVVMIDDIPRRIVGATGVIRVEPFIAKESRVVADRTYVGSWFDHIPHFGALLG